MKLLFSMLLLFAIPLAASADVEIPVHGSAIVRVAVGSGFIIIRNWDKPSIAVISEDAFDMHALNASTLARLDVTIPAQSFLTAADQAGESMRGPRLHRPSEDDNEHNDTLSPLQAMLAPPPITHLPFFVGDVSGPPMMLGGEEFVVDIGEGIHPRFLLHARHARATIYLPRDTAAILPTLEQGRLVLQGTHTPFAMMVYRGAAMLDHVEGTGFVQSTNGIVHAFHSNFARLRARTGNRPIILSDCRANQIDASSLNGDIISDDASFGAGPIRFDSINGAIAVGVRNDDLQIDAYHGRSGHFYSLTGRRTKMSKRDTATHVRFAGADGPTAIAMSRNGSVFVYDGGLLHRKALPAPWQPLFLTLARADRFAH